MPSQDYENHRIRRVDLATGATTTLAGSGSAGFLDGDGANAEFNNPAGIAIDPTGTFALVTVRAGPAPPPALVVPKTTAMATAAPRPSVRG